MTPTIPMPMGIHAKKAKGDSADGAGRSARGMATRDPELRRGASSELAADVSELGSEEEEEDDSDEDGAFEVVPVAKTARR